MKKGMLLALFVSLVLNVYFGGRKISLHDGDILERTLNTIIRLPLGQPTNIPDGYYLQDLVMSQTIWVFYPNGRAREIVFYPEVKWKLSSNDEISIASKDSKKFHAFGKWETSQIRVNQGDYTNDFKRVLVSSNENNY